MLRIKNVWKMLFINWNEKYSFVLEIVYFFYLKKKFLS